jgi:UDP-GlcNAc3NAcA epimerase
MKILTVIGARPQFIKAATVSAALNRYSSGMEEVLVHTGQHFDDEMSKVFFEQMSIPQPRYHLGVHSLSHGAMTGRMMELLEEVAMKEKPDVIIVYGDTNSTLAGALVASKLDIPVAHVEAGLRSFDMKMPEEVNRILTDRLSRWLFCPTSIAKQNLQKEGFDAFPSDIIVNGDVMLDAALHFESMSQPPSVDLPDEYIMTTVHRQATTDDPAALKAVADAVTIISEVCPVVLPLHPRTSMMLKKTGISMNSGRILVIPPVGYLESLWLIKHCRMVITDSGGLQKEAFFFGKPCLTLREETEWSELVTVGANITAGTDPVNILSAFHHLLNLQFIPDLSLYGDGNASETIAEVISGYCKM